MRHLLTLAACCAALTAQNQTPSDIEAVEYDPQGNRWFVSNGNSVLVTSDQGVNWEFFGEAEASHGMEIMNGVLYAIGGNVIRAYALSSAELLGSLAIPGVGFLNGMGNNGAGMLVVSDFANSRIHSVNAADPTAMTSTQLTGNLGLTPNGVVVDVENNRAIVVCWGNNADIIAVDLESGEVSTLVDGTGMGNLDGIDDDGNGHYYVTSWSPNKVTRYNADFTEAEPMLSSAAGLSSPADISYAVELDVLGIANSGSDEVTFHDFGSSHVSQTRLVSWGAVRFGQMWSVTLPAAEEVIWTVHDGIGRVVDTGMERLPMGTVHLEWPGVPPGGFLEVRCGAGRAVLR